MDTGPDAYGPALDAAASTARAWLAGLDERLVRPRASADELADVVGGPLPSGPTDALAVVEQLARVEPGLMSMQSGRFFGWVIGGTHPAAMAADWLVSAWDQNTVLRYASPATIALEEAAGHWLLDLLGLPAGADVGFTTGATMANFTGLAAGRYRVLADRGWDVNERGLQGAPLVRVLAGEERHDTIDLAARYLGLGRPTVVASDAQGRLRVDALADALAAVPDDEAVLLALQAGNLHSGAYDPFPEAISLAHERGAWVHVDGAFGLWAGASPQLRHLVSGVAGADSWATDAHKTLNVPYDCGVAVVRDTAAVRAAFGLHTAYLVMQDAGPAEAFEKVPEFSRRARGVPVWAVLRALGRDGVADLVDRLAAAARALAEGIGALPGVEVLNDVVFTQVCLSFGDDTRTRAVTQQLIADGAVWMSGSRWRDRDVLRISVSNWTTDEADIAASVDAVRAALAAVPAST